MTDFQDLLTVYQANMMPGMAEDFAKSLGAGITADVVRRYGVGYWPAQQCWILPERNENGEVIGLLRRFANDKKMTVEGSKRGMFFEPLCIRSKNSSAQPRHFIRVAEADIPCPACGRERDGCLVALDPDEMVPIAGICVRTAEGAVKQLPSGAGYLHHYRSDAGDRGATAQILPLSEDPVVICEGASDTLVAASLGYVAVGRPSADACPKGLISLVQGRSVILVGDRDPHGVGQRGLEMCYQTLKPAVSSIVKVLPPEGKGKDLRAWHPTRAEFEEWIEKTGVTTDDGSVLQDTAPMALVQSWLQNMHTRNGTRLLHRIHGDYYSWEGTVYRKFDQEEIRAEWYSFFTDKQVRIEAKDGIKILRLRPDRKFCADLQDAASAYCSVRIEDGVHEPFLIKARAPMDLARAVVFQNGILYLADDRLAPLNPDVFLTSTLPYDYHPSYQCPLWVWFVGDVFNGDQECVALLQEWFGYNLIASNHMQSMMFLFGVPGSGKSTTAGVLSAMVGPARCCGASTDNFKGLFGKETLLNKYSAIMSESRDTNRSDIDKLLQTWKAITGGDVINVARKYKQAVDARLFCRLTYVANDALPFDDTAQAMANRMNLLYFPNNYRKKNPDRMLEHKLRQELPGIALWSIQGLKRLLANDKFTVPATSREHLAQLAQLTNPIGVMLEECTRMHIGAEFLAYRTECSTLYDLWKKWCEDTKTKTSLTAIGFGMKLAHMERPLTRRRIEEAGERKYIYQGLEIRPESMKRYLM